MKRFLTFDSDFEPSGTALPETSDAESNVTASEDAVSTEGTSDALPTVYPTEAEGFFAGETARKKKGLTRAMTALISVVLTLGVAALLFFGAGYFSAKMDVFYLFHADPDDACDVAMQAFDALYTDCQVQKYVELMPPETRDTYVSSLAGSFGIADRDELFETINAEQKKTYETMTFSEPTVAVHSVCTKEYIEQVALTDAASILYGSSYEAEDIESIVNLVMVVSYSTDGQNFTDTDLPFTAAAIDGEWYLIG